MTREEEEQNAVDDWNTMNEVGCKVLLRKDNGEELEATTRFPAQVLCGTAVLWVHGLNGAYMLSRCKALNECIGCSALVSEPFPFETGIGEPVCDECGRERNMH